jgi:hypothetical protein
MMSDLLPLTVVAVVWLFLSWIVWRRPWDRQRGDDLMAVADTVRPRCTHIGRASEPDHLWHECDLSPAHDAGPSPLHHCACGAYWRRAPHETLQLQALDALYAEPDGRH